MPTGRPTKLTKASIAKAREYDWKGEGDVIPTIEGLALHLDVNRATVYRWMEVDAPLNLEFRDIASKLLDLQARLLLQGGLKGKFNPAITRLILSGKHGYVEKHEQSGDQRVTVEIQKYSEDQPPA